MGKNLGRRAQALIAICFAGSASAQTLDPCRAATPFARADQIARALERHTHSIRSGSGGARAHLDRGVCLERLGRLDEAMLDLTTALKLDPSFGEAYRGRARLYARQGHLEAAIGDLGQAIRIDPGSALAWQGRAEIAARLGRHREAAADAAALAEAGEFTEAVKWQQQAMERFTGEARAQADARLQLYREGKPFRTP